MIKLYYVSVYSNGKVCSYIAAANSIVEAKGICERKFTLEEHYSPTGSTAIYFNATTVRDQLGTLKVIA